MVYLSVNSKFDIEPPPFTAMFAVEQTDVASAAYITAVFRTTHEIDLRLTDRSDSTAHDLLVHMN